MAYSINDLCEMLSYQRGSGSRMEQIFIRKYIDSIPGIRADKYANKFKKIGSSDTMFTSHTDTVHPFNSNRQKVFVSKNIAHTDGKSVLGADDGTGVWLMLNMIDARVPGLYIFQRSEESGGVGSSYSSQQNYSNIKKCISFDRKGYSDVITHQGGRTCSDEFADALANRLGATYRPSPYGSFTDSANYSHIIPECTNISIGYANAHSNNETQDLGFAQFLLKRLLKIHYESLPVHRNPSMDTDYSYQSWDSWSQSGNTWNTWNPPKPKQRKRTKKPKGVYESYNDKQFLLTSEGWKSVKMDEFSPKKKKKKYETLGEYTWW